MHYCSKTITNTASATYQYITDSTLTPKRVTTSASASNLVIFLVGLNSLPLLKSWKNNIYFSHSKVRHIDYIYQSLQLHYYKLFSYYSYNVLSISASTHNCISYTLHQHNPQHRHCHHIEFEAPITLNFIVPKYIYYNIFKITPHILEVYPPELTSHRISFNTVMLFDIEYDTDQLSYY